MTASSELAAQNGIIYKSVGGFYYVKTDDGSLVECKPRGLFRKTGLKPVAGDRVRLAEEGGAVTIDEVAPRKNLFVRPPLANLDLVFIVAATAQPVPSLLVIDKLSAAAVDQETQPVLLVTKGDLAGDEQLLAAYATAGFPAFAVNAATGEGLPRLREMLAGGLAVFCGNSGVGKSTLLNALLPEAARETGEISKKLGRGRHTTREVEIFEVAGGLVADTPGFASFDLQRAGPGGISADNIQFAFPDIAAHMPACKFSGCTHLVEKGCAVREALARGEVAPGRYQSYVTLYEQAKESERRGRS